MAAPNVFFWSLDTSLPTCVPGMKIYFQYKMTLLLPYHTSEEQIGGVFSWCWWCYPIPSEGWGRGETPRRPNTTRFLHQRLTASTRWCGLRPTYERWTEMARQLPREVRPSRRLQSSGVISFI